VTTNPASVTDRQYADAMGRLLVLYAQVDRMIMHACAERLRRAPDEAAQLSLAKQVGDESRHVAIQREWMAEFGTDPTPVISTEQEDAILGHFRELPWLEFLADLYVGVEALGSEAVERIVPLTDPGTRESLRVPLRDELDHVAFGIGRLKQELAGLDEAERTRFLEALPGRIDALTAALHGFDIPLPELFGAVGAPYDALAAQIEARRDELLQELAEPYRRQAA
jgi:hypothetical protein